MIKFLTIENTEALSEKTSMFCGSKPICTRIDRANSTLQSFRTNKKCKIIHHSFHPRKDFPNVDFIYVLPKR